MTRLPCLLRGFCILAIIFSSSNAKLLMELTMEDGILPKNDKHPYLHERTEVKTGHGLKLVTDIVRSGKYALRFEIKGGSDRRSEMKTWNQPPMCERWHGYSQYLAPNWKKGGWGYFGQWNGYPDKHKGECWNRGPVNKMLLGDNLRWASATGASPREVDPCGSKAPVRTKADLGPMEDGVWMDWVVHMVFDHRKNGKGLIEIWRRKKGEEWGPCLSRRETPLGYNDDKGAAFKFGAYEPGTEGNTRVVYYDEIRVGDENSSFEEVAPGQDGSKPTFIILNISPVHHRGNFSISRVFVSGRQPLFPHIPGKRTFSLNGSQARNPGSGIAIIRD